MEHERSDRLLAPALRGPLVLGRVPAFSVIIAAYQAAGSVGEAVASALEQTADPLEVIVCDDGSSDDIVGALEPYRDRIVLVRREHRGEGAAKNAAARAASGEFVVILDADDVFLPSRLEALGELAVARPDLDILTTDAYLEAAGRRVRRVYGPEWSFEVDDQRRGILERNFIFGHAAVRRELLLESGGFDESILWTTDWDCWRRLIFGGARAGLVNEPLALYRVHESALSSRRARLLRGRVMTLEKAERSQDLTDAERAVLDRSLARNRYLARLEESKAALLDGAPDARRRSLAIARDRAYGPRTRFKAALSAVAPALSRRISRWRQGREWVGVGGTRVSRTGMGRPGHPSRRR